jgi:hypothetical protein
MMNCACRAGAEAAHNSEISRANTRTEGEGLLGRSGRLAGPAWPTALGPGPVKQYQHLFIQRFSNWLEFEMVQRISSHSQNISNKIWLCRELNKEQLFL